MSVVQYTALLVEDASTSNLAKLRGLFTEALEERGLEENTIFQFLWHPRAPSLTLVTVIENGVLGGEGYQLWAAGLGQRVAKKLKKRTWEMQLTSGSVLDQRVTLECRARAPGALPAVARSPYFGEIGPSRAVTQPTHDEHATV